MDNKQIFLDDAHFIAKGGERDCYIHPNDEHKVIKIVHRKEKHNEQNKLEFKYYTFLKKNKISLNHLSRCDGFINTNCGEGLVYERIVNYDNTFSQSFKTFLEHKTFSKEIEFKLMTELKEYLFQNNILFIDVDLSNVFCKEVSSKKYKLIIIDGLGARRLNWRFYLYLYSKKYTRYKIKKQWKVFFANYLKHSTYFL